MIGDIIKSMGIGDKLRIYKYLKVLFTAFLTSVLMYSVIGSQWNTFFGGNVNYVFALSALLMPVILFPSNNRIWEMNFYLLLSIALTLAAVYVGSYGSVLAFMAIWICLLINNQKLFSTKGIVLFVILVSCATILLSVNYLSHFKTSSSLNSNIISDSMRLELILNSMKLWREQPIFGIGAGNWFFQVYKYGLASTYPFNDAYSPVRYFSHNFYTKILAELGIIGFTLFYGNILFGFVIHFKRKIVGKAIVGKTCLVILFTYLVVSFFYASTSYYSFNFPLHLVIVASIVPLLNPNNASFRLHSGVPIILCFITTIWFLFQGASWHIIENSSNKQNNIVRIPIIKEFHKENELFSEKLALQSIKNNDIIKAKEYFDLGILSAPYDVKLLTAYAEFLYEQKELLLSEDIALRAIDVQDNFVWANYLLMNIYLDLNNYQKTQVHIAQLRKSFNSDDWINQYWEEITCIERQLGLEKK